MRALKYLLFILLSIFIIGFVAIKVVSDPLPEGQSGSEADNWANQIQQALNKPAFDTLGYLEWEFFRAGQKYLWDKKRDLAVIQWADNKAIMNLKTQEAIITTNGEVQSGDNHESLKAKAWSNWCNDSFWMIAPFKMNDPGTIRAIAETEDKQKGLKVTYGSGGVTPGDSYLWLVDESNIPTGYHMWTSIIPVQGMYAGWSGWESHKGVMLSTTHELLGKEMKMKGIKAGHTLQQMGYDTDPFAAISQ